MPRNTAKSSRQAVYKQCHDSCFVHVIYQGWQREHNNNRVYLLDVETNPEARIERVDVLQGLWDCLPIQVQLACQHRAKASLSLEY